MVERTVRVLSVLLVMASAAGAQEGRLVGEKVLFRQTDGIPIALGNMVLCDRGRRLLYIRETRGQVPSADGKSSETELLTRLGVLEIATGKRTDVPIPAIMGSDPLEMDNVLRYGVLSPDGESFLLPTGVDENSDGIFDHRREARQWVCYEASTGKVRALKGLPKGSCCPQFDHTGNHLIVTSADPTTGKPVVSVRPLGKAAKPRSLAIEGFPMGICPAAGLTAVLIYAGQPPRKPYMKKELALYDITADREVARLPAEHLAHVPVHRAQWTAGGRYLYYTDVKTRSATEPKSMPRRRTLTRVWDRVAGEEIDVIDRAIPVGPGPTPDTMVLGKAFDVQPFVAAAPLLHDASNRSLRRLTQVAEPTEESQLLPLRILTSRDSLIVYACPTSKVRFTVRLARIPASTTPKSRD